MDKSPPLGRLCVLALAALFAGTCAAGSRAQSVTAPQPGTQATGQQPPENVPPENTPLGSVHGTVTDAAGDVVPGASVTLTAIATGVKRTTQTDGAGLFNFSGVVPGTLQLNVSVAGFAPWTGSPFVLAAGEIRAVPDIPLQIASASSSVRVVFSSHKLAEQQVHAEEKQRVLGIVPNFYTSYVWHAEPLTSGQKFRLALRTSVDPVTVIGAGAIAGIQQWQNDFRGYGQGAAGYAKRFGASYADGFSGVMLGGAIFPSLFHQDPRYFYKGTGTIRSRALYALSTEFIARGDNGRWQPNYSNVLGTFAAAGLSNAYYPSEDRGAQLTIENASLGIATGVVAALLQEFVIKKLSRGVPQSSGQQH